MHPSPMLRIILRAYKSFRKVQQEAENKNKVSEGAEWEKWNPFQGKHQAIVLNYNGREWTQKTKEAAVKFVRRRWIGIGSCRK